MYPPADGNIAETTLRALFILLPSFHLTLYRLSIIIHEKLNLGILLVQIGFGGSAVGGKS